MNECERREQRRQFHIRDQWWIPWALDCYLEMLARGAGLPWTASPVSQAVQVLAAHERGDPIPDDV